MEVQHGRKEFNKYEQRGAYHWKWFRTNKFNYRDYVLKTLAYFPAPGTILDVGCGDGLISYRLFEHGFRVVGIDPDPTAIRLGRQRIVWAYTRAKPLEVLQALWRRQSVLVFLAELGLSLHVQSVYDLAEDCTYDYVLCSEVIEHVPDPTRLIEKVLTVVRQFAIITIPNGAYNTPGEEDYQFWNPENFLGLFGKRRVELLEADRARICVRAWGQAVR